MTNLFKENKTVVGEIVDGEYKINLIAGEFNSPMYKQEVPGVYYNPERKQYILRCKIVEGDYEGYIFSLYATEIDLTRLIADFVTQLGLKTSTPVDVMKTIQEKPVTLYRGVEEYTAHDGSIATTRKWYANQSRFRKVTAIPETVETTNEEVF